MAARVTIWSSEILSQVQAGVQRPDLIGVAVEHEGLALEELPHPPLPSLTPARVVHLRVHIGVETVFARRRQIPGGHRLALGEPDLHQRLAALEAILPRYDQ